MNKIKKMFSAKERQENIPWWALAIVFAGALSLLVGWILSRRMAQGGPMLTEGMRSPRLWIEQTPVEPIAPVVQEIPLPIQRTPWPGAEG